VDETTTKEGERKRCCVWGPPFDELPIRQRRKKTVISAEITAKRRLVAEKSRKKEMKKGKAMGSNSQGMPAPPLEGTLPRSVFSSY
jgi:hypothetical protein